MLTLELQFLLSPMRTSKPQTLGGASVLDSMHGVSLFAKTLAFLGHASRWSTTASDGTWNLAINDYLDGADMPDNGSDDQISRRSLANVQISFDSF